MACTSCAEARKSLAIAQAMAQSPAITTLDAAITATSELLVTLRAQRRDLSRSLLQPQV